MFLDPNPFLNFKGSYQVLRCNLFVVKHYINKVDINMVWFWKTEKLMSTLLPV